MKKKKRIPVIAAALSLVAPGLGQLYNGQISKGIIFFLAILPIPTFLFLVGLPSQFLGLAAIFIIAFCLWVFIIAEAFVAAKRKKDKQVYINDQPLEESYKVHSDTRVFQREGYYRNGDVIRDNFGPIVVPPGHCFVMGDSHDNSMDSRWWGPIPLGEIKAKPLFSTSLIWR
jgi:hypothetical protein